MSNNHATNSSSSSTAWRMKSAPPAVSQSRSPPPTATPTKHSNSDKKQKRKKRRQSKKSPLRRNRISKESMNRLVMDYLVGKGYRDVAEAFWRDSNTKPHVDLQSVQERMSIQQLLLNGDVPNARSKLEQLDPLFLSNHVTMAFLLAKQELIELIKLRDVAAALTFATQHLAPFGETNPLFLQEIEQTMALLAFANHAQSHQSALLGQTQRQRVADAINAAILRSQKQELEPLLPTMVRQFHYMESQLADKIQRPRNGIFGCSSSSAPNVPMTE